MDDAIAILEKLITLQSKQQLLPKQEERRMNINDLTLGQIKEIKNLIGEQSTPVNAASEIFKPGTAWLFRTVTHIEVGRVKRVIGPFVELEEASWIADTGRYHDCLKSGVFSEVEPYPIYTGVNTASLINYAPWPHDLPREQK